MKGVKAPFLLCITLHASSHISCKMAAQKHAQFQLVISWHSLLKPQTKTWLVRSSQLFFACQLYVMMYHIIYRMVALVSRYVHVWYHEKLYCCSPKQYWSKVSSKLDPRFFMIVRNNVRLQF